jgi:hypothetical protein
VTDPRSSFTQDERATLHSLAEMFQDKEERDELRKLLQAGTTLRELVMAYKVNLRMVTVLKASGGMIVLLAAVVAALRGLNFWTR